jgi:hypothetical protein
MRIFKKAMLVVGILIILPFIIALFVAKDYKVVREISINKSKKEVFDYIKHLKNQDNYSKWALMDPNMIKTYTGTDAQPGFVSRWESEKEDVGTGEQEIIKITEGERVDFELRFIKPFEATEDAYMITESESDNKTNVKWGFNGHMDYPMNLMLLFMDFETMIGTDLETGLKNLKVELEEK